MTEKLCVQVAIEPPAGIHLAGPRDSFSSVRSRDVAACAFADGSCSWGTGAQAGPIALREFERRASISSETELRKLAMCLEEGAFQAQAQLASVADDADALFSAALLVFSGRNVSCAWAGDLLVAVCSVHGVRWLNFPNHAGFDDPDSRVKGRPAPWWPGLLGCAREQRPADLLEQGPTAVVTNDHVLLALSASVWQKVDETMIARTIAARRSASKDWQRYIAEDVLRFAKQHGAKGHRTAAVMWFDAAPPHEPMSRAQGYRALAVQTGDVHEIVVEERETQREVVRVSSYDEHEGTLSVDFIVAADDINYMTACGLIYELVLEGLLEARFEGASSVVYRDTKRGFSSSFAYAPPFDGGPLSKHG